MTITYIGGGSKSWAWTLVNDLCFEKELSGTFKLYDIDFKAAQDNAVACQRILDMHNPGHWTFQAEAFVEEALEGADFVFLSITPGGWQMMQSDVHTPEDYGIYQSVGDTVGPGGIIRALRTIPTYSLYASLIREYCPDAWVFNYTNPMTICTRTLYRVFPQIKAFGCCHEVFKTQILLAQIAEYYNLVEKGSLERGEIHRTDVKTRVMGINHFTWIDKAELNGIDLMPYYKQFVDEHPEGWQPPEWADEASPHNWQNDYFKCAEKVKFDLFKRFGIIAAAGDRHLAEFCPHSWYLENPLEVKKWKYSLTPVAFRLKKQEGKIRQSMEWCEKPETFVPKASGEDGIDILKALYTKDSDKSFITNVNMPNKGQIKNLMANAVVETNAKISWNSIKPEETPGIPENLLPLMLHHVATQEAVVKGALAKDYKTIKNVFCSDIAMMNLSPERAEELFDQMCEETNVL